MLTVRAGTVMGVPIVSRMAQSPCHTRSAKHFLFQPETRLPRGPYTGEPVDMWKAGIVDPLLVKTTALKAAGEIAKSVLRIDKNLAAEDLNQQALSETKR